MMTKFGTIGLSSFIQWKNIFDIYSGVEFDNMILHA